MPVSSIGGLIAHDPEAAKRELEVVLRKFEGDPVKAAASLKVSRRQLDRWVKRLGLSERQAKIRAKVKGKGDPP